MKLKLENIKIFKKLWNVELFHERYRANYSNPENT